MEGIARLGKSTKHLIGRIQPGEIVIIDHADLDRIAAEGLVEKQVKAVINASAFCTGRYPNLGAPASCAEPGSHWSRRRAPRCSRRSRTATGSGWRRGRSSGATTVVAKGEVVTLKDAEDRLDASKRNISNALEKFAENTLEYMINEKDFLLEAIRLPKVKTNFHGRHVLVVVRGYGYKKDLATLRGYIRDLRPILVGVDGGADALLELKLTPHVIIGDMDSVSTKALGCGAELIVHAYSDGVAPGAERLDALHLRLLDLRSPRDQRGRGDAAGPREGGRADRGGGRPGQPGRVHGQGAQGDGFDLPGAAAGWDPSWSTPRGSGELHRSGPNRWELFGLVGAAVVTMLIVIGISQPMRLVVQAAGDWLSDLWFILGQASVSLKRHDHLSLPRRNLGRRFYGDRPGRAVRSDLHRPEHRRGAEGDARPGWALATKPCASASSSRRS